MQAVDRQCAVGRVGSLWRSRRWWEWRRAERSWRSQRAVCEATESTRWEHDVSSIQRGDDGLVAVVEFRPMNLVQVAVMCPVCMCADDE